MVSSKCLACFYLKKEFPFDYQKGIYHNLWDFCIKRFRYIKLEQDSVEILCRIKPIITTSNPLFPLKKDKIEDVWHGTYKWKPFDPNECKLYLNIEEGLNILLGIDEND